MEIFNGSASCWKKEVGDSQHSYSMSYFRISKENREKSAYMERFVGKHMPDHYVIIYDKYSSSYKLIKTVYKIQEFFLQSKLRLKAFFFKSSTEATVDSLRNVDAVAYKRWGDNDDKLIEV